MEQVPLGVVRIGTHRRHLDRGCGDVQRRQVPELPVPVQGKGGAQSSCAYVVTFAGLDSKTVQQVDYLWLRFVTLRRWMQGFRRSWNRGSLVGKAMLIVASFFMLWRLKVAAATTGHLHYDMEKKVMTLTLTVSKTEVKASGVKRSWRCVCKRKVPCQFCSIREHLSQLVAYFGAPLPDDLLLPKSTWSQPSSTSCRGWGSKRSDHKATVCSGVTRVGWPEPDTWHPWV